MSRRALQALACALALLVAAILAARRLSRGTPAARLAASSLASEAARLEVSGPAGAFALARSSSGWALESPLAFPADSGAVEDLLKRFPEAELSGPLTRDNARHALFGLSPSSATRVRVLGRGGALLDVHVGKAAPDMDGAFVRFDGKDEVLQASGLNPGSLARPPGDWLDKTVCALAAGEVARLAVRSPAASVDVRRSSEAWYAAGARVPVSTSAVSLTLRPALDGLLPLEASTVIPAAGAPASRTGLGRPELTLTLAAEGKAPVVLKFGRKDDSGMRYALREGEGRVVYLVGDWKLDPFRRPDFARLR